MLSNVRLFYSKSNIGEVLFAALTMGAASFFIAFGIAKLIGFGLATTSGYFALIVLLLGTLIPASALARKAFTVPRTSKALLLATLSMSLVILRMII